MGVSGCPVWPSTVLMDGLGKRLMPWVTTPAMPVLLALLMLALEPDEEYEEGVKVVESMSFSWDGLSASQGDPFWLMCNGRWVVKDCGKELRPSLWL